MEKEQEAVKDKKKMDIVSANPLYKYVKGVFTLIGKDGNSTLFLNDAGLHCKTNDICIKIQGFINGVSVFEELEQEKEYELCICSKKFINTTPYFFIKRISIFFLDSNHFIF